MSQGIYADKHNTGKLERSSDGRRCVNAYGFGQK